MEVGAAVARMPSVALGLWVVSAGLLDDETMLRLLAATAVETSSVG